MCAHFSTSSISLFARNNSCERFGCRIIVLFLLEFCSRVAFSESVTYMQHITVRGHLKAKLQANLPPKNLSWRLEFLNSLSQLFIICQYDFLLRREKNASATCYTHVRSDLSF